MVSICYRLWINNRDLCKTSFFARFLCQVAHLANGEAQIVILEILNLFLPAPPVEAKRKSRNRGPACPVAPADGTGVAPADGTGVAKIIAFPELK